MKFLFYGSDENFSVIESTFETDVFFADSQDIFFDLIVEDEEALILLDFEFNAKEAEKINKILTKKFTNCSRVILYDDNFLDKKLDKHKGGKTAADIYLILPLDQSELKQSLKQFIFSAPTSIPVKDSQSNEVEDAETIMIENTGREVKEDNPQETVLEVNKDSPISLDNLGINMSDDNEDFKSIHLDLDGGMQEIKTDSSEKEGLLNIHSVNEETIDPSGELSFDLSNNDLNEPELSFNESVDGGLDGNADIGLEDLGLDGSADIGLDELGLEESADGGLDDLGLDGSADGGLEGLGLDGSADGGLEDLGLEESADGGLEDLGLNESADGGLEDLGLNESVDVGLENLDLTQNDSLQSLGEDIALSDDFEEVTFAKNDLENIFGKESEGSDLEEEKLFDLSSPDILNDASGPQEDEDPIIPPVGVDESLDVDFIANPSFDNSLSSGEDMVNAFESNIETNDFENKTRVIESASIQNDFSDENLENTVLYTQQDLIENSIPEEKLDFNMNSLSPEMMAEETILNVTPEPIDNISNLKDFNIINEKSEIVPEELDGDNLVKISKYHEDEYLRLQGILKQLRLDRTKVQDENMQLQEEIKSMQNEKVVVQAELDEVKIELSIIKKRHQSELEEARYQMNLSNEKREIFETKSKNLQREFERLSQKIRVDINQVRQREKNLESQLELITMDSESQVRSRDQKILDLKRTIDALEFNMENVSIKEEQYRDEKQRLEERLSRIMKTIRGSIEFLEDDFENEKQSLYNLEKAK